MIVRYGEVLVGIYLRNPPFPFVHILTDASTYPYPPIFSAPPFPLSVHMQPIGTRPHHPRCVHKNLIYVKPWNTVGVFVLVRHSEIMKWNDSVILMESQFSQCKIL